MPTPFQLCFSKSLKYGFGRAISSYEAEIARCSVLPEVYRLLCPVWMEYICHYMTIMSMMGRVTLKTI